MSLRDAPRSLRGDVATLAPTVTQVQMSPSCLGIASPLILRFAQDAARNDDTTYENAIRQRMQILLRRLLSRQEHARMPADRGKSVARHVEARAVPTLCGAGNIIRERLPQPRAFCAHRQSRVRLAPKSRGARVLPGIAQRFAPAESRLR